MSFKLAFFIVLAFSTTAHAMVVTSTFGPGDAFFSTTGYLIGKLPVFSDGEELGVEFTPATDVVLTQVRVALFNLYSADRDLIIDISQGDVPGAPIDTFETTIASERVANIYTLDSARQPFLVAGLPYWMVLSSNDFINNSFSWNINEIGAYSLLATRYPGRSLWKTVYNVSPTFEISGDPFFVAAPPASIPEPQPAALVISALGYWALRRRQKGAAELAGTHGFSFSLRNRSQKILHDSTAWVYDHTESKKRVSLRPFASAKPFTVPATGREEIYS